MRPPEQLNAAEFVASADDVFGRIASRYDLLCDLFSFWIHRNWKRRVALLIASQPWTELLDSASGTGHIVERVLGYEPIEPARRIVASDISPQMLAIAKRRLAALSARSNCANSMCRERPLSRLLSISRKRKSSM